MLFPPLKWAGGKRRLIKTIKPIWEKSGKPRIVEPFCGGIAVALGLQPQHALLNDINPHLINFYSWVKDGLEFEIPTNKSEEYYYERRARFNELIRQNAWNSKESAQLFYYLNKTCFNGLCRFNRDGYFNVPVGRFNYEIKYLTQFNEYRDLFNGWNFSAGRYGDLDLESTDFVFADPPYDVDFRGYSKDGFTWEDQKALVSWLDCHAGPIILCNHATDRIIELYRDFHYSLTLIDEKISITANGSRKPAKVILAYKNLESYFYMPNRIFASSTTI